jgi:hypothetical protein
VLQEREQPVNPGSLCRVLIALRLLLGVLIAIVVAAAIAPMLVIADLAGGGTGWGLCPDGITTCTTSYFAGPELLAILLFVLFAALGGVAICSRLIRRLGARL